MDKTTNRLSVEIPSDLYLKFKQMAALKYNFKKGYTKTAIIEAVKLWIEENDK